LTDTTNVKQMAAGLAALSICESLLLALSDLNVLARKDLVGVLDDAAAAHIGAGVGDREIAVHREAAAIIERILAGRNALPQT
jgi:hypothetical protein